MFSHDNISYASHIVQETYKWGKESTVSFLPLSHIAALVFDVMMPLHCGGVAYCADKNALKGTLVCSQ
jgi:long-chain-fatty-acid--CoA ligase ACSBG